MHDLIIVGAGPAGLAAALYATRKRLDFLVLSKDLGGKANYQINLPDIDEHQVIRAKELVTIYKSRLEYLRHSYRLEGVKSVRKIKEGFEVEGDKGSVESSRALIVATGTSIKRLAVPGEMRFLSRGIGSSAISYSHLLNGRRVFLIGNTDRVLDSVVELSIHSDKVTLVLEEGTYDPELLKYVRSLDRVDIIQDGIVSEFRGDDTARGVVVSAGDGERVIEADAFFLESEPRPNTSFLSEVVRLDDNGFVPVDSSNMTSVEGLFAAGDVTGNGFEQILVALGEGAKAALSAYHFLLYNGLGSRRTAREAQETSS